MGLPGFSLSTQWLRSWMQPCEVCLLTKSTSFISSYPALWNSCPMTIHKERNTDGTQQWYVGRDRFFDLERAKPSILSEGLVVSRPVRKKRGAKQGVRTDFSRFAISLQSKRTLRRNKPGYTAASIIIRNLLISVLKIADSENASYYINNSSIKAIAISLKRDGLGLKPSLKLDERKKVIVGSTKKMISTT